MIYSLQKKKYRKGKDEKHKRTYCLVTALALSCFISCLSLLTFPCNHNDLMSAQLKSPTDCIVHMLETFHCYQTIKIENVVKDVFDLDSRLNLLLMKASMKMMK